MGAVDIIAKFRNSPGNITRLRKRIGLSHLIGARINIIIEKLIK